MAAEGKGGLIEQRRNQNATWNKGAAALTVKVGELFRRASPRFKPPSEWWCNHIAQALMVARDRAKVREGQPRNDPYKLARKYAGLFVRHAPLAETALSMQVEVAETMAALGTFNCESTPTTLPEAVQRTRSALRRFQQAVRAVEACKADLDLKPWPDREPIRFVAGLAQQAWAFANAGKAPAIEAEKDMAVLSGFVFDALIAVGMMRVTRAEVRAVLRGERRNK